MSTLLGELGKKLTEKWFTLLVLPGMLYVGVAAAGAVLGQRRWADAGRLGTELDRLTTHRSFGGPASIAVLAGIVLLTAAVGALAQGIGTVVEGAWLAERWPPPLSGPSRWLTDRRAHRWASANHRYLAAKRERALIRVRTRYGHPDMRPEPDTESLSRARDRIAFTAPRCPTWIGDRMRAVDTRVLRTYDLDLGPVWPTLWLVCPQEHRDQVDRARAAFSQAAGVSAWGVLYLLVGLLWWPAAVAGLLMALRGWRLGRAAIAIYAGLIEGTVDLHGRDLAVALGFDCPARLVPELGLEITKALRKDETKY